MRPSQAALPLLLIAATFVGCLKGPTHALQTPHVPVEVPDWALRALDVEPGHLHNLSDDHRNHSSANFELLGWTPVPRQGSASMGGGGCGAVNTGPGRKLAVFTAAWDNAHGLAVVDVTDPARPQKLGEVVSPQFGFRDAEITPDGKWAVGAASPTRTLPSPIAADSRKDACANQAPPSAITSVSGTALIDLSDPTKPAVVDLAPEPDGGAHSVYATTIAGTSYVISSHDGIPSDLSRFYFYTIDQGRLVPYGVHTAQLPRATTSQPLMNLHTDAWIQRHPKTGDLLAYIANWDSGLVVLRMDGPGRILPYATWTDYDPAKGNGMTGQIHSVMVAPTLWDGKHYTFIGQELIDRPLNRPTGQIIMLDTTDPSKPTAVSRWTLPVDPGKWDKTYTWCCLFSTHYLRLVNQTLFVAMYHGGVWAVDARPGQGPEMASLGAFVPSPPDRHYATPTPKGPAPFVEEIYALENGDLVTFDDFGGLYTFRFHPEIHVPIPAPWTADAWIK